MITKANSLGALSICILAGIAILAGGQRLGAAAESGDVTPEAERIRTLVRDEVARQLPDAVAAEVKKQIDERVRQSQSQSSQQIAQIRLDTVRAQLILYGLQHPDKPTLAQLQDNWSVLMHRTDEQGNLGDPLHTRFGPYLAKLPCNPFNNSTSVAPIGQATPKTGWVYNAANCDLKIVVPAQYRSQFNEHDTEVPGSASVDAGK